MFKFILRCLLRSLYRVDVNGKEQLQQISERTLVVANHTSFLDAVLLYAYLPVNATFAINTYVANSWLGKAAALFSQLFPLDPGNALSVRALVQRLKKGGCVVIFPEGRITVTGALMKIYHGPGMVADHANATLLPIRIEGAQYSPFARLQGRKNWFPKITLCIEPARCLYLDQTFTGRERRQQAGLQLAELMGDLMFATANQPQTLAQRLLAARRIHGGKHIIAEDINRSPIDYNTLLTKSVAVGRKLANRCPDEKTIGVLLPGTVANVVTFWGLQLQGKVPAMLNYTAGTKGLVSACETATLSTVITSRSFIEKANLEKEAQALSRHTKLIYLEDIATSITIFDKLRALISTHSDTLLLRKAQRNAHTPAVVLFTSGSEGTPKGVVLSHHNLLSNIHQLLSRIDFNAQDIALNSLPLFHSFGLTAGMLLPLTSGVRVFFYPSPLHYRVVPEVAYDINATIMFGTNTFLANYARFADNYDFYSMRYIFAGAEKLQEEVRRTWLDKFGVRIFEGYGATETAPVIAGNTPMTNKAGTVGRMMPGMEYRLIPVPGLTEGQRLEVRGPNVMLGYLLHDTPGVLVPPASANGHGWYDTGDIVTIDQDGFITICGRAKRFAKIAGEMVSLSTVESAASKVWPDALHAAISLPNESKGEQIILLTTADSADRKTMLAQIKQEGLSELNVPKHFKAVAEMPVLGSGKIDYVSAQALVEATQ